MNYIRKEQTLKVSLNSKTLYPEHAISVNSHRKVIFNVAMIAIERMESEFGDIKLLKEKLVEFITEYDKIVFSAVMSKSRINNLARDVIAIQSDGKNNLGIMYKEVTQEPIVLSITIQLRVDAELQSSESSNDEA